MEEILKNTRRLAWAIKVLKPKKIYTASVWEGEVNITSLYDGKLVNRLVALKFSYHLDANGFTIFSRGKYRIILT
jgi:hypothetical protein